MRVLLYGENWTMVLSHMTTSITIQPYLYIHTIYIYKYMIMETLHLIL